MPAARIAAAIVGWPAPRAGANPVSDRSISMSTTLRNALIFTLGLCLLASPSLAAGSSENAARIAKLRAALDQVESQMKMTQHEIESVQAQLRAYADEDVDGGSAESYKMVVWLQNRLTQLLSEHRSLSERASALRREIAQLEAIERAGDDAP
jgi:prefoldin subunit 5